MRGDNPKYDKYDRFKFVFMSFTVSFFIFSFALFLMMKYLNPRDAKPVDTHVAQISETEYKPVSDDALTVLFMGAATKDASPELYLLAKFDPQAGAVTLLALPPETAVRNNEKSETLTEVYKYGGAQYTKEALAKTLGIDVNRFVRMDYDAFIAAADAIGSVEILLNNDVKMELGGAVINMLAGRQLLDGQKLLALMRAYKTSDASEDRYGLLGELCAEVVSQRIDIALSTAYEQVFEKAINLVDTDISYSDFHSRLEAAAYLAKQPGPAVTLTPSGTWSNGLYVLSDTFLAEAAGKIG